MQRESEQLPWQAPQLQRLLAQHAKGKLAHAYLLQGASGIGKFTFARHFAHYLLCNTTSENRPCGQCQGCHLFVAGSHPDLKLVEPEEGSRVIKIEQVRASVDFMGKTANQGGYKIVIFRPVESMNINAANALLKVLEEPPAGTLLLLLSHQPGLVLATLKSRCQALVFPVPEKEQAKRWLDKQQTSANSEVLLALADGAPLKALSLGDEEIAHRRSRLHDCLLGITQGRMSVVEAAQQLQDGLQNRDLDALLETLMFSVHDLLRVGQSNAQLALKDPELQTLLEQLDIGRSGKLLHMFYQELLSLKRALVRNSNPNPKLTLESLLFSWSRLS